MKNSFTRVDYKIHHRRLYAFMYSKVLNGLMFGVILTLFFMPCFIDQTLPVIIMLLGLALMIGYSIWLWVKRPSKVTVNSFLSELNSCYSLYFLIVIATKTTAILWHIIGGIAALCMLFLLLIRHDDKEMEI